MYNHLQRAHVLDTETIGIEAPEEGLGGVCEISLKEVDITTGNLLADYHSIIDPEHPISYGAMGTHHITPPMVQGKPTLDQFLIEMCPDVYGPDQPGVWLIAHNAQYDVKFLKTYIQCPYLEVDTLKLARRLYPEATNHRLQTLRYELNLLGELDNVVEGIVAHSAKGDTDVLLALVQRMMLDTGLTLFGLCELGQEFVPIAKWPFGKYFGQNISETKQTDRRYIQWVLGNVKDLDPDLRKTLEMK